MATATRTSQSCIFSGQKQYYFTIIRLARPASAFRLLLRVEELRSRHQKGMQMREIHSQIIITWRSVLEVLWKWGSLEVWLRVRDRE